MAKRHVVNIERSLLMPVPAAHVPPDCGLGIMFRVPQRFSVHTGLSYQPQDITNRFATFERRLDADTVLVRFRLL